MENKLNNLKDSMMKTVYKDFSFNEKNKKAVYKDLTNKNNKRSLHFSFKAFVSVAVLFLLIIGLTGTVLFQTGIISSNFLYDFPGEEKLENNELLEKYHLPIKLPTYLPFEIEDIRVDSLYVGPIDLTQDPPQTELDNPAVNPIIITYVSTIEKNKIYMLELQINDATNTTYGGTVNENVTLKDGNQASFNENENSQMILWTDQDTMYNLYLSVRDKDDPLKKVEDLPKEEIIKIANSFNQFIP
ncbi:DUF4367 domain-containing protein [Bacillus sp. BGMRC 2118]|nr:DUF4367 domain-containing protein [Bacillus sp. BGMRC 2118]